MTWETGIGCQTSSNLTWLPRVPMFPEIIFSASFTLELDVSWVVFREELTLQYISYSQMP